MSKVKSIDDLLDKISNDASWRKKELLDISLICKSANNEYEQKVLCKIAICLFYSHWEGLVKYTSQAILKYLKSNNFTFEDLNISFRYCAYLDHHNGNYELKNSFLNLRPLILNEINLNSKFTVNEKTYINTRSNLNYETLVEILEKLGIKTDEFLTSKNFINETLLGYRNPISHGENRVLSLNDFKEIASKTFRIIDSYLLIITDYVANEDFRAKKQP